MKQYLYTGSYSAERKEGNSVRVSSTCYWALSVSDNEATGAGIGAALGRWPQSDGWTGHQATAMRIPDHAVARLFEEVDALYKQLSEAA